jgi:transcription elongation factor GreA
MTITTDVTEDQVVLTREGRHLLEARLGHLNRRVIPELRAALADREDDRPIYELERAVEDGALLERLLGVAVVAEDRPGGTDAVQLGDAVTVGLPDTQERFLIVHPLEAALDSVRISASSPLGRAVLGRRAGDLVDVASPAGRYRAQILAVERTGMPLAAEVAA